MIKIKHNNFQQKLFLIECLLSPAQYIRDCGRIGKNILCFSTPTNQDTKNLIEKRKKFQGKVFVPIRGIYSNSIAPS